jgi:hypothetical protein
MKSKTAFTKKDLLVVLGCIIFLLANIAAIGEGGRKRAKAAACLSNLLKWGQIFQAYTADNDGFFHSRQTGTPAGYTKLWSHVYKPYYIDPMMRCCPAAANPYCGTGPFGVWGGPVWDYTRFGAWNPANYPVPGEDDIYWFGSYGINTYVENQPYQSDVFWRRVGVNGASQVPVFLDCMYVRMYSPYEPPLYNGDINSLACIDRHGGGSINSLFLDFSARKVDLKELWTLKWHRYFDTCGPWTICGNGGDEQTCAQNWDANSPWMKDFPEY